MSVFIVMGQARSQITCSQQAEAAGAMMVQSKRKSGSNRKADRKQQKCMDAEIPAPPEAAVPAGLTRTAVYRKVPVAVRCRLDKAILLRGTNGNAVDEIHAEFDLAERFGVSARALRSYARKLADLVKPAMSAQVMAAMLGCLPNSYRSQLVAGSQTLLLSRVISALTDDRAEALSASDLGRLATVLEAIAKRSNDADTKTGSKKRRSKKHNSISDDTDLADESKVAQAIRMVYGLTWPTEGAAEGVSDMPQDPKHDHAHQASSR
jgi:hypothetical protein